MSATVSGTPETPIAKPRVAFVPRQATTSIAPSDAPKSPVNTLPLVFRSRFTETWWVANEETLASWTSERKEGFLAAWKYLEDAFPNEGLRVLDLMNPGVFEESNARLDITLENNGFMSRFFDLALRFEDHKDSQLTVVAEARSKEEMLQIGTHVLASVGSKTLVLVAEDRVHAVQTQIVDAESQGPFHLLYVDGKTFGDDDDSSPFALEALYATQGILAHKMKSGGLVWVDDMIFPVADSEKDVRLETLARSFHGRGAFLLRLLLRWRRATLVWKGSRGIIVSLSPMPMKEEESEAEAEEEAEAKAEAEAEAEAEPEPEPEAEAERA